MLKIRDDVKLEDLEKFGFTVVDIDRIDYDIKKTKEIISNDQKNSYQITRLKAMNTKSLDIKKRLQELLESEE